MTIADYIIETLSKRVSHAYGVYGAANAHLFDAIKRQLKLQMICTAGEQGAGFAAEGHAKATSGIGLCITTSGPGALNAATSVANCHYDSVPVLFLCGQVSTKVMRRDYSSLRQRGFQECAVVDVMKPISKYCREIREPHEVKEALDSALQMMTMGRPGPAVLSLPLDVLSAPVPAKWPAPFISETLPDNTPSPDVAQVHGCLTALRRAERPIILVGGGCRESASAVRRFAETVGVHVFRTWNALDIAPDDWPLYGGNVGTYGGKGRNFAVQQADFALVLGCRLSGRITGGATKSFLRGARAGEGIWHVDADYGVIEELEQDVPNRKKIRAYVDAFLRVAQESLGDAQPKRLAPWRDRVRTWRDAYGIDAMAGKVVEGSVNPYAFVRELSRLAPSDAIVVSECGGNAVIFHQSWESKQGQRIFSSHGGSAMGQGIGLAIGAAIAAPERPVIAVIGDGGFALSAAELNTIRIQRDRLLNLRIFVLNNRCYGITRAWQKTNLDKRFFACGPDAASGYEAPDVLNVCDGFDVPSVRTTSTPGPGLFDETAPTIWDVDCDGWQTYEPYIRGFDRPIEEMQPSLPEAEFLANMRDVKPMPGWKERR